MFLTYPLVTSTSTSTRNAGIGNEVFEPLEILPAKGRLPARSAYVDVHVDITFAPLPRLCYRPSVAIDNCMPKKLELSIHASCGAQYVPFLKKHLLAAHKITPTSVVDLSIALVGNPKMAKLHQQFMNIPGPTDVLTFELDADDNGCVTSGEVVICVPHARKIAQELKHDLKLELLLYAIHGLLHLSGFDDLKPADFRKMHAMEDKILKKLGFKPVFDWKGHAGAK